MKRKKIPLGLSSYKKIITEGYCYIDKTKYIEALEGLNTKNPVLLSPPGFGKTVFASMLQTYYDINEKNNFEVLFIDKYIGKHKTKLANSYYVLYLSFSGLDTEDTEKLEKTFGSYIKFEISRFIKRYQIKGIELDSKEDLFTYTHIFFNQLRSNMPKKLYIIIDDYDHFSKSFSNDGKELQSERNNGEFIQYFYEVLKKHTKYIIDRIYITGVNSFNLNGLISGFNISTDVSNYNQLNNVMGFTEKEIISLFDCLQISDSEKALKILTDSYRGHQFSESMNEKIYNMNVIFNYMKTYKTSEHQCK